MENDFSNNIGMTIDIKNDVIPELKTIQNNESKFNSLTLFIVTIIIFFSAGIVSLKWQDILILIGVLLCHEIGHLIGMKILKYNDVKIFFIPFIGAAASGKSKKDTATKSCLVSLMGPLPGILLGVILYFLFALTKNYYVLKTAQIMLILNSFNFLPIMPLDGGRYIDVLFINSRYFRLFFALLGAAIFIILAISTSDILFGIIGAFSIFSAVTNFKIHGIANTLKSEGIRATSLDELLESENSMQIIVNKFKEKYPKSFSPKIAHKAIYNQLVTLVNTIKFVPARLISKSFLLIFYLIMLLISIIISFFFIAMDYREIARIEYPDGEKIVYIEHHVYGTKMSECPIDDNLFYNGKGTAFNQDSTISDIFFYSNGYRTGEWLSYNSNGDIIRKAQHKKGQLISVSTFENGIWKTNSFEELSFLAKSIEAIKQYSQPYKSNHLYFQE